MNNIIQWNIQALNTHFSDLKILLNRYNPSCVCLQETLIRNRIFPPSGYNIITSNPTRDDDHERGTAILIKNDIFHQPINLNTNLQAAAAKVNIGKIFTICSIYLPHIPCTKEDLITLINQLQPPFLLLGDFNAKSPIWGGRAVNSADARGRIIEELLLDLPISIINDESPTHYHIQTNTYSTIDLSICSSDCIDNFNYSVNESRYGSDHYPIHLKPINYNHIPYNGPLRYNFKKANWLSFKANTRTEIRSENFDEIDSLTEYITKTIINSANTAIPFKSRKPRKPPIPWWNEELTTLKRNRNIAERALRRNNNIENKIAYNRSKARLRYHCNIARRQSWHEFLNSINQNTTLNHIWKKVQMIGGKFKPSPLPILKDENHDYITDQNQIAEILANHFSSISNSTNYTERFQRYKNNQEQQNLNFNTNISHPYNDNITQSEFDSALQSSEESSPGPDNISYSMIKHCHDTMKNLILKTFNRIFITQTFPTKWKTAIIVAIAKPGKDQSNPQSYRPISLTNCLCKLLEKIINVRLIWFLEYNNLITNLQSGFRSNRSTTDNIIQLETAIQKSLHNKQHFIAVFFDLQKAYDTAWKFGIIKKIHEYGLRGNLPIFLRNFLSNRCIKVRVGGCLSEDRPVEEGIPQGSVLSCSLFMIAINDICDAVPENVQKTLYVDDFTIFASGNVTSMIERRLQVAISNLEKWCGTTGFTFSAPKTVSIHICRKRNCPKFNPNLSIYNNPITTIEEVRYLGVIFDKSNTWKPHISNLRTKAFKTIDLLKHLTHKKWGADCISLIRLYIMLLKPLIEYGIEAFSSAADTYMRKIETLQNSAIRIATGAFKSSPIPSIHAYTGIKPLKFYVETKMLNYFLRIKVNTSHPLHLLIDEELPPKSYLERCKTLIRAYNLDLDNLMMEQTTNIPPWVRKPLSSCSDMYQYKKQRNTPQEMRNHYENHLLEHAQHNNIYTDGSKIENGTAYSYSMGNNIISKRISPNASNYTAELYAIFDAIASDYNSLTATTNIITDSKSGIQAIEKYYNKDPLVLKIHIAIHNSNRNINLCWVPSHCGVPGNEAVDHAARTAALEQNTINIPIPRSDIKALIKAESIRRWRSQWQAIPENDNKLRKIKADVSPLRNSLFEDRLWERVVCRIRVGHTALTHGFLMSNDPPPECQTCHVQLTVYHILMDCPHYSIARQAFQNCTFKDLLCHHAAKFDKLYQFILQSQLLYEI